MPKQKEIMFLNYNALRWSVAVNFAIQSSLKQSFHAIARLMDSKLCSLHIGIVGFVLNFTPV